MKRSKLVKPKDIKCGVTFHIVHALGSESFVSTIHCLGRTTKDNHPEHWKRMIGISVYQLEQWIWAKRQGGKFKTVDSLCDCGVYPQNYNKHKTFKKLKDAENYADLCRKQGIGARCEHEGWLFYGDTLDYID